MTENKKMKNANILFDFFCNIMSQKKLIKITGLAKKQVSLTNH